MKRNLSLAVIAMLLVSCRVGQLNNPVISVSNSKPFMGAKLILAVPHDNNATAYWSGPIGTYVGDSWIIDNVSKNTAGDYAVKYVSTRNSRYASNTAVERINIQECSIPAEPLITASSTMVETGTNLILAVQPKKDFNVVWSGPEGTYTGNPWVKTNVSNSSAGVYTAKYVHSVMQNCESLRTQIAITVRGPRVITKLQDSVRYMEILYTPTSATVWLRKSPIENTIEDIPALTVIKENVRLDYLKKTVCEFVDVVEKSNMIIGCVQATGAAACAFGTVSSSGAAAVIPICTFFMAKGPAAIPQCVLGLTGEIAASLGKSEMFTTAATGASISKADIGEALTGLIQMYCLAQQGKTPIMGKDGQVIEKPKPAPPANNGNGGSGSSRDGDAGHHGTGGNGNNNRTGPSNQGDGPVKPDKIRDPPGPKIGPPGLQKLKKKTKI